MLKVGPATCSRLPELAEDDRLFLNRLRRPNADPSAVVWDDPQVQWSQFDRIVIRSCWDYHPRLPQFLDWLSRMEGQNLPLRNPAPLVRSNANKTYLKALEAAGFPVVPTAWVERGWAQGVVKPPGSASAFGTWRVTCQAATDAAVQDTFEDSLAESDLLVQPFVPDIERRGGRSSS